MHDTARAVCKTSPTAIEIEKFGAAQIEVNQVRKTHGNDLEEGNVDAGERCQGQRFQTEREKPIHDAFCTGMLRCESIRAEVYRERPEVYKGIQIFRRRCQNSRLYANVPVFDKIGLHICAYILATHLTQR